MLPIGGLSLSAAASRSTMPMDHVQEVAFKEKIAALSKLHSRDYPKSEVYYTPLQRAVILGDVKECENLIRKGVDMDEKGVVGRHPLIFANKNEDIIDLLFPLSCVQTQTFLLCTTFLDDHMIFWKWLMGLAHREAKSMFYLSLYEMRQKETSNFIFENLPPFFQQTFLLNLFKTTSCFPKKNRDLVIIFRFFFEKAAPEIRNEQELRDILDEMNKRDDEFTNELMTCRLFGHRFSIRGDQFEGLNKSQFSRIFGLIARSLETVSSNENRFLQLMPKMISETIEVMDADKSDADALSLRSLEKPTIVPCGWDGHTVVALFSRNILVTINTGQSSNDKPNGITFYSIRNRDFNKRTIVIKKLFQHCSERVPAKKGLKYFTFTLFNKLDAELIETIPFSQTSGNCAWSAIKLAVLAHFILFDIEAEQKPFSKEAINHALHHVAAAFDEWDVRDRILSVSETMPLFRKHPLLFDLEHLRPQIEELFKPANFGLLHQ